MYFRSMVQDPFIILKRYSGLQCPGFLLAFTEHGVNQLSYQAFEERVEFAVAIERGTTS